MVTRQEHTALFESDKDQLRKMLKRSNMALLIASEFNNPTRSVSEAAVGAVSRMNPEFNCQSMAIRVCPETEDVLDHAFWSSLSYIVTGLDNVNARRYCDEKAIRHGLPMLDSGTLGPQANTTPVFPNITENYGAQPDPQEKEEPACLIHNFPNNITHCLVWARDRFEGFFHNESEVVNAYLNNEDFVDSIRSNTSTRTTKVETIVDCISPSSKPSSFADCVEWAMNLYHELFVYAQRSLLLLFPVDKRDETTGALFWTGAKRPPVEIPFDVENPLCMGFVRAGARLRAEMFNIEMDPMTVHADVDRLIPTITVKPYTYHATKIEDEEGNVIAGGDADTPMGDEFEMAVAKLPARAGHKSLFLHEFEKDDDSNDHIAFIHACANLRASNYRIETVSKAESKRVAGRIIPAMITTTAAVVGLVAVEQCKTLSTHPISDLRQVFLNLAIPIFQAAEPAEPNKTTIASTEEEFTVWDSITVDGASKTLSELVTHVSTRYKCDVDMVTCGTSIVYNAFKKQKMKEIINLPLAEALKKALKATPDKRYVELVFGASYGEDYDDVELPPVIVTL
ncbi:ubiquitin/SUMO-activating enzyme E1 [Kipferlia bialata]|uniref:Ubiquitin/SUMO-activating enzyme E1 n=1 Tax=Kipferlia bialata TaxID=797122 RepID=A0A9K3CP89_9EUKA|nr:ubiquitin/SUMO-activating enzyme E1 [Kipferlia bialata]|eukprot:g568.t1